MRVCQAMSPTQIVIGRQLQVYGNGDFEPGAARVAADANILTDGDLKVNLPSAR